MTLGSFRRGYERFLEWICIVLMNALAVEVTAGVLFRYSGNSLVWYDEVATILLAWVGYSILEILASDRLVSLPDIPVAFAQSTIPISAVLIVIAQLLVFPELLREARAEPTHAEKPA